MAVSLAVYTSRRFSPARRCSDPMIPNGVHLWLLDPATATGLPGRILLGRAGPVELATGVKVEATLEEGCCGRVGPRTVSPGAIAEAPIGLIKNANEE